MKIGFTQAVKNNIYFFVPYFVLLIIGAIALLIINKGDFVIYFNSWRGSGWDEVFKFYTLLGEGYMVGALILILGAFRFKYFVLGLCTYVISGAFTQILKNIFGIPRPQKFFEGTNLVTFVSNIDLYSWNSFPSGHSTTGFAIFLLFALLTKNKQMGAFYLLMASMVAVSRVYLVQHFLIDIYFGSIIGVVTSVILYNYFENSHKINSSNWYNYSFLNKFIS